MSIQITTPTKLLDENGNVASPGYAKSMLYEYNRKDIKTSKMRIKEWDYYLVYNTNYAIALTVADNGYMGLISASFINFDAPVQITNSVMTFMPLGKFNMPGTSKQGDVKFKNKRVNFEFLNQGKKRILKAEFKKFYKDKTLNVEFELSNEPKESMVIATPFDKPKHFYLNQKIVGFKAKGRVTLGEEEVEFKSSDTSALLDWGRGVWTYKNTWYWSSACGEIDGKAFGFNLGYGFGNTQNATENMLFYQGKAHKLDDVAFEIPKDKNGKPDFMSEWKFTSSDKRVNLKFTPIIDRHAFTSALIISSNQHQVFGNFDGTVVLDDGTKLKLKNFLGFAEKVDNKW